MKQLMWIGILLVLILAPSSLLALDDDASCRTCHSGAARDFSMSGKNSYMSCMDCHGEDHNGSDSGRIADVTPETCRTCHKEEVAQFNAGKHYFGWEAMESVPTFAAMPGVVTEKGCSELWSGATPS